MFVKLPPCPAHIGAEIPHGSAVTRGQASREHTAWFGGDAEVVANLHPHDLEPRVFYDLADITDVAVGTHHVRNHMRRSWSYRLFAPASSDISSTIIPAAVTGSASTKSTMSSYSIWFSSCSRVSSSCGCC